MRRLLLGILLTLGTTAYAQTQKIIFKPLALQEAIQQAKAAHKLVFVDCYTEWCVPCKQMEAGVFKTDSVAAFVNTTFIPVKLDMEKGEGPAALKAYTIGAFPSYLLLDGEGKVMYKFVGGMPADKFMAHLRTGMQKDNVGLVMTSRYAAGDRDPDLMRELVLLKIRNMEIGQAHTINDELIGLLSPAQRALPKNWVLFEENRYAMYLSNVDTRNFNYLVDHWRDFAATNTKDSVDHKMSVIFRKLAGECLTGYHFKKKAYAPADFEHYKAQLKATEMPDKKQLLVMMDMAAAAGEKDIKKVTALFEKNLHTFSEANLRITWDYFNLCASIPGYKYPRLNEIADQVIKQTKNPFLVTTCEMYKAQAARVNHPANGDKSKS